MENFGLRLEQVRTEVLQVLRQHQQEEALPHSIPPVPSEATTLLGEEEAGNTCTFCDARCPGYFRHCFNCGQPLSHEGEANSGELQGK